MFLCPGLIYQRRKWQSDSCSKLGCLWLNSTFLGEMAKVALILQDYIQSAVQAQEEDVPEGKLVSNSG